MSTIPKREATVEDLAKIDGKAEIIDGEIVLMSPTSDDPVTAAGQIFISLDAYAKKQKRGRAYTDNTAFIVNLLRRRSFSPDASYYLGPRGGMQFLQGPPVFAVEVRSEGDYGPRAEQQMAAKRADYFAAGTAVVWDVDLLSDDVVRVYRAAAPEQPTIFRRGELAEAEPAVPGWTMPVDDLYYVEPE